MKRLQSPIFQSFGAMRCCVLLIFLTFVASTTAVAGQPTPPIPSLVISPPGDGIRELFEHPNGWKQARALTGALLYADHNLSHFSDDELRKWFRMMHEWGMRLELEVGAIKEWGPTADETFRAEVPMWDRALRLGADIGSIAMDEPLVASRGFLHKPDGYAIEQTARFVELVRQRYPTMRIGDIESYPGIPLEDHIAWLQGILHYLNGRNIRPLDFYRVDIDWVSFAKAGRGSWQEVSSLATSVRKLGVLFSVIYWASGYPSEKAEGLAGEDTWYVEVLGQGYALADAGVGPDQFVLESWLTIPTQIVPETADFSFTRSALDFARKFSVDGGQKNTMHK